jgi:hypothetical protein
MIKYLTAKTFLLKVLMCVEGTSDINFEYNMKMKFRNYVLRGRILVLKKDKVTGTENRSISGWVSRNAFVVKHLVTERKI